MLTITTALTFDIQALDVIQENCSDCEIKLCDDLVYVSKLMDHEPDSWEEACSDFGLDEVIDSLIYVRSIVK